jgi:cytochrome c
MNGFRWPVTLVAIFSLGFLVSVILYSAQEPRSDPKKGKDLFEHRCTGCHRLDEARVGPPLRNIFGKAAAAQAGFPYSAGLKASRVVWDEATLDRWLADPDSVAPDNDMSFRMANGAERAAIIAYLKSLSTR